MGRSWYSGKANGKLRRVMRKGVKIMAETIIRNLEKAAKILEHSPDGSWPISPRIEDLGRMNNYVANLKLSATIENLERYAALRQTLAQLGLDLPEVQLGG